MHVLWPAACTLFCKVSDDAWVKWSWISHVWNVVISVGGIFYRMLSTREEKLRIQWPCSNDFRHFAREFCPRAPVCMDPSVGHLNSILSRVRGNLNNNFQKGQMPRGKGGCAGGCPGGDVEASIWPIHYLQKSAYGSMPLQPVETRPRYNFPELRVAFPRYNQLS